MRISVRGQQGARVVAERGLVEQVRDEGWAVVRDFCTTAEVEQVAAAATERPFPELSAAARDWIGQPRWAGVVQPCLGPDVRLLRAQVLTKHPRSAGTVPWHQDNDFVAVAPAEFLTAILAVDRMTTTNGGLQVLPGSHHQGVVDYVPSAYLFTLEDPPAEDAGVAIELDPGDLLVMSSLIFHRSGPNQTEGWRRTWLLQFLPAAAVDPRTGAGFDQHPRVARAGTWIRPESS